MHSPRKATIIFVAIFLFLLSFVSAELNKRDPQAPAGGNPAPAAGGNPGGGAAPAAGGNPGGGAAPAAGGNPGGGAAPAAGGNPGGGAAPAAGGNPGGGAAPAAGGNPGGGAAPAAGTPGGGAAPAAGGNPGGGAAPAAGAPGGGNPTPAAGGKVPAAGAPAGAPTGGTPTGAIPAAGGTNTTIPITVNPLTPPVTVQILEPKGKDILFKIGKNVTFQWQYSSNFADPPQYISVAASPELSTDNLQNKIYYNITTNMTLNATQEVTWVTANEQQALPMAKYRLYIYDERGISAPPKPGGLLPFSGLEFGLYTPQTTDDTCSTCTSNAISISTIPLLSTICFTLITLISFNFILV